MKRLDQGGGSGVWIFLFILTFLLFIGTSSFGVWAYLSREDYKKNVDPKIAQAVQVAKLQEDSKKQKEYTDLEKKPYKQYQGPSDYGSIIINYPKTWSAFVTEASITTSPVDGYFHPNVVPGLQSGTAFALRLKVLNQAYDEVVQSFSQQVKAGKVTVSAFRADKVPSVLGSRVDGVINTGQQDSMVIFPLRDKTIEISTESNEFLADFNTILSSLTFSP